MTQTNEAIDVNLVEHRVDLTTPDVTELFEGAPVYAKFATIEARQATEPEPIYTVLANGTRETSNTAEPGDWIARNPGGEEYVIKGGKFVSRYQPTENPGVYRATGIVRAFVNPTGVPVVTKAPWGEDIAGDPNCMLAAVVTEDKPDAVSPTDRYIIGADEFKDTYAPFEQVYNRPFGGVPHEPTSDQPSVPTDVEPPVADQAPQAPDTLAAVQNGADGGPERPSLTERGLTIVRTALRAGELVVRNTVDYLLHEQDGQTILGVAAGVATVTLMSASEFVFPGHGFYELASSAMQGLGHLALQGATNAIAGLETLPTLGMSTDPAVNRFALDVEALGAVGMAGVGAWAVLASGILDQHRDY